MAHQQLHVIRNTAQLPSTQAIYTASRVRPKRKISCAAAKIAATLTISFPRWRHMSLTSYWGQQRMSLTSYPGQKSRDSKSPVARSMKSEPWNNEITAWGRAWTLSTRERTQRTTEFYQVLGCRTDNTVSHKENLKEANRGHRGPWTEAAIHPSAVLGVLLDSSYYHAWNECIIKQSHMNAYIDRDNYKLFSTFIVHPWMKWLTISKCNVDETQILINKHAPKSCMTYMETPCGKDIVQ